MEEKKKKFPIVMVVIIVIGLVLFLTGLVICIASESKYVFKTVETETIENNFDAKEIQNLSFDLGVGKFSIKAGDTDKIQVLGKDVPKDRFKIEVSGNTFVLKSEQKKWYENINLSFDRGREDTVFEIVIPDKLYDKTDFECGVGEICIEGLDSDIFNLDGGVGTIDMIDCNIGKTDIDAGVGKIDFQGKLLGDMELDMGVGEVDFDIDGYENDYSIKKDGNVKIISSESGSENSEKYKINIDNGVGALKFKFK